MHLNPKEYIVAKYQPNPRYTSPDNVACLELFHSGLPYERHCTKPLGHPENELHGDHYFAWPAGSGEFLTATDAKAFLRACEGLVNGPGNDGSIFINEDGYVVMTLAKFKNIAG